MTVIDKNEVDGWLEQLASELKAELGEQLPQSAMIGIRTGGVAVAARLHKKLGLALPLGQLNISFYRDDFSRIGMHPVVGASDLPFSIDDQNIILVDDVLHSGRTIRAAMNEIFDFGRPSSIFLAVLADRAGRQLPIQADVRGTTLQLSEHQHIKLNSDSMNCSITTAAADPSSSGKQPASTD